MRVNSKKLLRIAYIYASCDRQVPNCYLYIQSGSGYIRTLDLKDKSSLSTSIYPQSVDWTMLIRVWCSNSFANTTQLYGIQKESHNFG